MRRLLVPELRVGEVTLSADQAHHARDVLRLTEGTTVELFTADGRAAEARLARVSADGVVADVREVRDASRGGVRLTIASAVPKAARADWMIEKLSELGVARFVPLQTERSIVHPEGRGKLGRWERLAAESAKQCRRAGVMEIAELARVEKLVEAGGEGRGYLSTGGGVVGLGEWVANASGRAPRAGRLQEAFGEIVLLVGPEGGWSERETASFDKAGLTPLGLGATILRVETAAIAAAAVVAVVSAGRA
ncbi:MAG TPA: RsmE family RNA methyltransferase [Tepidisphaeraceae bacterium]|nr:RsmE family RNA methyltransferase [Tepidisphaeraceae bacterium]